MLDQDNRYYLALRLAQALRERHGEELLLCGLYGSAMRGTDTPWSGLDLFCVVSDLCPLETKSFLYRGIHVGVEVKRQDGLELLLDYPTLDWPRVMGILSVLSPLAGDGDLVTHWLELGESAPPERFRKLLGVNLPDLVFESYGRLRSSIERREPDDLLSVIYRFLGEMNLVLCLLNRRWLTRDGFGALAEVAGFPLLPAGYAVSAPGLWRARSLDAACSLADRLFAAYLALLTEQGLLPRDYADLAELDELF
ncbi:MAG TPA: hypothetical protein ENN88_00370 [Candidatus Coatesbacteria bacterium]|nr:hypothetical protein [Candidatus Coatesbacteria bacterium]